MSLFLIQSAKFIALFLIVIFTLSLMGRYHWIFALLSHFKIQYFIGGMVLCGILLGSGNYILSFVMVSIALTSYMQTRLPMAEPWEFSAPLDREKADTLKIVQYNKYHKNTRYNNIKNSLEGSDLIIIQESNDIDTKALESQLSTTHPYGLPKGSMRPNYLLLFSKYEIQNLEIKRVCPDICQTYGTRFETTLPESKTPVAIYTIHTEGPFGRMAKLHNAELHGMADWISQDKTEHIIFVGDINSTPYAPAFQDFQAISKLRYQNYSALPQSTWPSFTFLPILQIPIDHILFSNSLRLRSIERGHATGSDHHALFAEIEI